MIRLGLVIWFGGRNKKTNTENDFGFIRDIETGEKIYVHLLDLECNPGDLNEGIIVSYQERQQRRNKKKAIHVNLIEDETNIDALGEWIERSERKVWLVKARDRDRDGTRVHNIIDIEDFTVIYNPLASRLRELLSVERRFHILKKIIQEKEPDNSDKALIQEEVERLTSSIEDNCYGEYYKIPWYVERFWNEIDSFVEIDEFLWKLSPVSVKVRVLNKHIDNLNDDDALDQVRQVIDQLDREKDKKNLAGGLSDKVFCLANSGDLREFLSIDKRLDILKKIIQERELDNFDKAFIQEEVEKLIDSAKNNHHYKSRFERFWDEIIPFVRIDGFLWKSSPVYIKAKVLNKYTDYVNDDDALDQVRQAIDQLGREADKKNLVDGLSDRVPGLLDGKDIRELLSVPRRSNVIAQLILQNDVNSLTMNDIESEVQQLLEVLDTSDAKQFWEQVKDNIEYHGFLWRFANQDMQKETIRIHFNNFFEFIDDYKHEVLNLLDNRKKLIQFNCSDIYTELGQEDWVLAETWAASESSSNQSHKQATMISARAAEKVAQKFFSSLGHSCIDTAILQLTGEKDTWKICDIIIDDDLFIDVKNTRYRRNNKNNHRQNDRNGRMILSEVCVPRFKKNRNNDDVLILGVMSPYLKLDQIQGLNQIPDPSDSIFIVGGITQSKMDQLQKRYVGRRLSRLTRQRLSNAAYLPAWMMDYSDDFYRPIGNLIDLKKSIFPTPIPSLEEVNLFDYRPFPIMIQFNRDLPEGWQDSLASWEQEFYNRLLSRKRSNVNDRFSLPELFLELLTHFLEMLSSQSESYHPHQYSNFLYFDPIEMRFPLNVTDPFGFIESFIRTLGLLWDNQRKSRIHEFTIFKFDPRGILQGQRPPNGASTTIIAYCGGSIYKEPRHRQGYQGKCLNSPLILGKHQNCQECGKLICDKCDFCSEDCAQCYSRRRSTTGRTPTSKIETISLRDFLLMCPSTEDETEGVGDSNFTQDFDDAF